MTFQLNSNQLKRFRKWAKSLPKNEDPLDSFCTSRFTFSFIPSGIGDTVTVEDCITGINFDLTDEDDHG